MSSAIDTAPEHLRSIHVQPDNTEWRSTKFRGCEVKPLYVDHDTGLMTLLMRMAPGAMLPDHEHVFVEQTYVIEGRLEDKEGPEKGLSVGPGQYVARPAGSRHAAWCPEGALMLAIFQMPNKFFEPDGNVVDFLGKDWESEWGEAYAKARRSQ